MDFFCGKNPKLLLTYVTKRAMTKTLIYIIFLAHATLSLRIIKFSSGTHATTHVKNLKYPSQWILPTSISYIKFNDASEKEKKKMMRARGLRILSERQGGESEKNVPWEIERLNLSFRFVKMKFDPSR